ncbi:ABC transporter substrate-binding protein [Cupriavidus pauculus]|uniref:Iron ABC transporter substrate-binding protein n=1 Tax=Cupriavidus pauculus TaxID=82633 RepID=A0A2N5C220_9BURK|nr:ABC transporter substrate-binding protein [Cupriavidus pauculus]PLP96267.1 iron ABC transporter substrate-binding protein [Cupriavidus pauculus]
MPNRRHPSARRRAFLGLALYGSIYVPFNTAAQEADEMLDYAPRAQAPPGYTPDYAGIVRAAEDEGRLVVYATTDADLVGPLLAEFQSMYPRVKVEYEDLSSTEIYHRYLAEIQLGTGSGDVLWSSAMDLQASLVERGYALRYATPEVAALPDWAHWQDQAWATSVEPVAIAYNRRILSAGDVPNTHAQFAQLLVQQSSRLRRKVITYDIEKSGLGLLLATQDAKAWPSFWDMVAGLGAIDTRLSTTTADMLRRVGTGAIAIAYNVLGAYTLAQARKDPNIGFAFLTDYTLALPRFQLISRRATHPNAARLWVDYTLSRRGQARLAERAGLYTVRSDITGEATATALASKLGRSLRPITLNADLTRHLDIDTYRSFVRRWRAATKQS